MKRITQKTIVDIGCLIAIIPSLVTGFVLYVFLPEGNGEPASYLGIIRTQWIALHN
ncbi:MAG: hypothetical protein WCF90_08680 [Methanomicrobiales archaeon]